MSSHDSGFYEFNDPPRLSAEEQSRVAGLAGQAYHLLCKQPNKVCLVSSPLIFYYFILILLISYLLQNLSVLNDVSRWLVPSHRGPTRSFQQSFSPSSHYSQRRWQQSMSLGDFAAEIRDLDFDILSSYIDAIIEYMTINDWASLWESRDNGERWITANEWEDE